jgi:hypothetical protein
MEIGVSEASEVQLEDYIVTDGLNRETLDILLFQNCEIFKVHDGGRGWGSP